MTTQPALLIALQGLARGQQVKLAKLSGVHTSDISRIKKTGECRLATEARLLEALQELEK